MTKILLIVLLVTNLFAVKLWVFEEGELGLRFCTEKEIQELKLDKEDSINSITIIGVWDKSCDETAYQLWLSRFNSTLGYE